MMSSAVRRVELLTAHQRHIRLHLAEQQARLSNVSNEGTSLVLIDHFLCEAHCFDERS